MDNKPTYICDPEKNKSCSKEECYISGGTCSHTFNKAYEKKQTNQDKLAEMVRTMDPEIIAKAVMADRFAIFNCFNCPAMKYCDSTMKSTEDESENPVLDDVVTCEEVMNKWLRMEATE